MSNVHDIGTQLRERGQRVRGPVDSGGGGPHDPLMEERVKALEKFADEARGDLRAIDTRLTKIETRMDGFATKEDLHKELSAQTWRLVTFVCSFGTALVAATYYIATHVK